jgi:hypothetical protein
MRLIGALASGEAPTAAEANDALLVLQQMIDSWNADRLMCFTITISEFPLVVGQQVYTLGTGGDFNIPRPARIERTSIVSLTNPAQPLELEIDYYTDLDWQDQPVKIINSSLPQAVYDDQNFPLRNLSFWPIPTQPVNTRLYCWTQLTTFDLNTTDVTFPPGYIEALRYNLAVQLMAEMPGDYNQATFGIVTAKATETMGRVRSINVPMVQSFCDPFLSNQGGYYNYYSDEPAGGRRRS